MSDLVDQFSPRIDAIETQWSMIRRAHHGSKFSSGEAKNSLVMRYLPAIRGYVGALTRDDAEADELSQEAVVRILKGDFSGADPERGRFRDLLKISVRNMVRNHWAKQNRCKTSDMDQIYADELGQDDELNDPWLDSWRVNLLEIAWAALKDYQDRRTGRVTYTILKLRSEFPDVDSPTLAAKLSEEVGVEFRADATRQHLRRARIRFAEFLVEEIAHGLETAEPGRIQEELIALGLYNSVKDLLPVKWKQPVG